jgi:hypothetical protein
MAVTVLADKNDVHKRSAKTQPPGPKRLSFLPLTVKQYNAGSLID